MFIKPSTLLARMFKYRHWRVVFPILSILLVSIVFGVSVLAVIDFGTIAAVIWCIAIAFFAGIYFSDTARERIHSEFVEEPTDNNNPDNTGINEKELRDFVYLDSLTVQSLLASLNIAIPEETTELNQQTERVRRRAGLSAGISAPSGGKVGGTVDLSKTDVGTDLIETSKKINDQYIFDQLYKELESRGEITSLPDEWENNPDSYNLDGDELDIVKIVGKGKTDPVYRMANVLSLISRVEVLQEYVNNDNIGDNQNEDVDLSGVIEDIQEVVFGDQIGVEFDVSDDMAYVASLDEKDLWVDDPRREFADSREYTVLGRVVGRIPEDDKWDYIDIFRIGATVLDSDSMKTMRSVIDRFIDHIDGHSTEVPLPNLEDTTTERMANGGNISQQESDIQLNVEDKKIYVDGPGLIIDPIAIYW